MENEVTISELKEEVLTLEVRSEIALLHAEKIKQSACFAKSILIA